MLGDTFAVCSTVAGILSEGPGLNRPRQICPCLVWIEGCWEQKDCRVALLRMSLTVLRRPVCCKQLAHMYWGQLYSGYAAAPAVPDDVGQPASVTWYGHSSGTACMYSCMQYSWVIRLQYAVPLK